MGVYEKRRKELFEKAESDCVVLINIEGSSRPSLLYFTGFSGTFATLVLSKKGEWIVTDPRYTEQAKEQTGMEVIEYRGGKKFTEFLSDFLRDLDCEKIGIEKGRVSLSLFEEISRSVEASFESVDEIVRKMRMVKDEGEIEKIRKAVEIAERAFMDMLDFIKAGKTEREVAAYLEYRMKSHGAEKASFDTIIASGERAALPHGVASDKVIKEGDIIVVDFGCVYDGYVSDITRMVSIGEPKEEHVKIHEIVVKAQDRAIENAKPGMKGSEIDALARDYIESMGYGREFGHGLGHGIGIEVHEGPRISRMSEDVIEEGMVFTVEPGIYLEGRFGVRVEEDVVMRESGVEVLTKLDRGIFVKR